MASPTCRRTEALGPLYPPIGNRQHHPGDAEALYARDSVSSTPARRSDAESLAAARDQDASLKTPVGQLSGGNQQKTMLAKWLNAEPRILVLDEPTRGIDVGAKADVHRFIDELARAGLGIILISSDLPEVLAMSDRVAVMREGLLREIFTGSRPPRKR